MTHDTLCPCKCDCGEVHNEMECEPCDLIANVRKETLAAAVQRVEAHLIMLDGNGWMATLNGEGYSELAGFGPGLFAAIKGDQP